MNSSGKGLLHWKAFQIEFEQCNSGKRLLPAIYSFASGAAQVFFPGKLGKQIRSNKQKHTTIIVLAPLFWVPAGLHYKGGGGDRGGGVKG